MTIIHRISPAPFIAIEAGGAPPGRGGLRDGRP